MEEWKCIEGYKDYEVSNLGNIRSYRNNKGKTSAVPHLLSPKTDHNGYYFVNLYSGRKMKSFKIHRLVASAFIPNPENYPQINHIDEVKTNNCVGNLEWCSAKQNVNHGTTHLRSCMTRRRCCTKEVYQFSLEGDLIQTFYSCSEAARQTGLKIACIAKAANHLSHFAGNWLWSYTPDYNFSADIDYINKLSRFKGTEQTNHNSNI